MSQAKLAVTAYTAECTTWKCAKYVYKTAIDKDDIQLRCTKCGNPLSIALKKD